MNDELYRLYPINPDTDSKIAIVTQQPQRDSLTLTVEAWRRLLPNQIAVPIDNPQKISYQCSPLDLNSCIEVRITYKLFGKMLTRVLVSPPIQLTKQLREKLLYQIQPLQTRVSMDHQQAVMILTFDGKKLRFRTNQKKFEIKPTEDSFEADPNPTIVRLNLQNVRNQFAYFFSTACKYGAKLRSAFCVIVFRSKSERDLMMAQIANSFKETKQTSQTNIKILETSTPRNEPRLKNDNSATSLTSANLSRHKDRKKVKLSERINLKKSSTPNKMDTSARECLDVFQEDAVGDKAVDRTSDNHLNDTSMDLRGSFEQFQQSNPTKKGSDQASDNSFGQKKGNWLNPIDQQNKKLREQNDRLRQSLETMGNLSKQMATLKKKYAGLVEENNRLQNQRRAIITDKVRFESNYHRELQQKQALKKELQTLKMKMGSQGYRLS